MRQGEHAARASLGFFFRYFDGMYRREDIVEALAKAVALPAPTANHCNSSCCYMLGAALWFLDYVKQEELWEELIPLLPQSWTMRSTLLRRRWTTSPIPETIC